MCIAYVTSNFGLQPILNSAAVVDLLQPVLNSAAEVDHLQLATLCLLFSSIILAGVAAVFY